MRVFRSSFLLVALTAMAVSPGNLAWAQEPITPPLIKPPTVKPPAQIPPAETKTAEIAATIVTARLARAIPGGDRTIRIGSATWTCRGEACTTADLAAGGVDVGACRQLRDHVGRINGFGNPRRSLSRSELERCNASRTQTPAPGPGVTGEAKRVAAGDDRIQGIPRSNEPPPRIDQETVDRTACPDPAVVDLRPRLVSHRDRRAVIDLIGVVRNQGRAGYLSEDDHRQSLVLREDGAGSLDPVVERVWFGNLAPRQEVTLTHRIVWNTEPREIRSVLGSVWLPPLPPPRFRLQITYAAANEYDANTRNDDCGAHNNDAILEPADIRAVVH